MTRATSAAVSSSNDAMSLAERAGQGDIEATGALLKILAPHIIRTVRALLGTTHADVDDVVQRSLIAFLQALPNFRGECSPYHFASRIAVRMVLQNRRRTQLRVDLHDEQTDVDSIHSGNEGQHEAFQAEKRRALIRDLLSRLPENQAETLMMRVGLGFSLPEVSEATGVPLNTVRSRVRLAKEALRKHIEQDPTLEEMLGDS